MFPFHLVSSQPMLERYRTELSLGYRLCKHYYLDPRLHWHVFKLCSVGHGTSSISYEYSGRFRPLCHSFRLHLPAPSFCYAFLQRELRWEELLSAWSLWLLSSADFWELASWFHFLCKNVTANVVSQPSGCADPRKTVISQSDWTWIRTSAFLRWSNCQDKENASAVLVLFSATKKLRDRFQRAWNGDLAEILIDPFSLFAICLDELWMQSQDIVDIARKEFGEMELVCQSVDWPKITVINHM